MTTTLPLADHKAADHKALAWRLEAACAGADPELFFNRRGEFDQARRARIASAKQFCARCPVRADCLAEALEAGERGIWGGLTERERHALTDGSATTTAGGAAGGAA